MQDDGTLEEMQEDEVLFQKNDEYPMIVALTQATAHNKSILSENILEAR